MVTTDDDALAVRIRLLRQQGSEKRYHHEILGYNFRLTELAAAIGRAQLAKLDRFNEARRRNAEILSRGLAGIAEVALPRELQGHRHVYHQYTIRVDVDRDLVQERLRELGIGTSVHYPLPVHKQPLYVKLRYGTSSLPVSELMAGKVLSLPVHPGLTDADLDRIIDSVRTAVSTA